MDFENLDHTARALTENRSPRDGDSHIRIQTRIQRHYTIGKTRHKTACRLSIIDNGPGITPHLVERIFYPMISGRADGSGPGLPIAQTIISLHKDLIECNSELLTAEQNRT